MEICQYFLYIYWDDYKVFIPHFVNVMSQFNKSVGIKPSLHPWDDCCLSVWLWLTYVMAVDPLEGGIAFLHS